MMLLWESAGTGHYGYSGEIPVAVVRPLAAIEGPWTWTLLVGPPTVLQAFEAAGRAPRGPRGAEHRTRPRKHVSMSRMRIENPLCTP